MAAAKSKSIELQEHFASGQGVTIDAEKGLITGVKVLGHQSANGRSYPITTQRASRRMLEGAKVNIDHTARPGDAAPLRSRFAILRNVRDDGQDSYGDLHYNPKHHMAEEVAWWAKNEPSALGLSINAHGKTKRRGGKDVVEEISVVHSVDLVGDPATTKGLFEHRERTMKTTVKAVLEAIYAKQPKKLKKLREDMPADVIAAPMEGPAPDADDSDLSPEEQIRAAMRAMIDAVLDDDSLDIQGMLDKIEQILQTQQELLGDDSGGGKSGGSSGGGSNDNGGGDVTATEGRRHTAPAGDVATLREELAVRDLIEEAGITFAKPAARRAFARALVPLSADERAALIEERRGQAPGDDGGGNRQPPPPIVRSGKTPDAGNGQGEGLGKALQEQKSVVQFLRTGALA